MKKTLYLKLSDNSLIKEELQINNHIVGDSINIDNINYTVRKTALDSKMVDGELIHKIKTYTIE